MADGSQELSAGFMVNQATEDLKSKFITRHASTINLLAGFLIRQEKENLLSQLTVRKETSQDFLAVFLVEHSNSSNLLAGFKSVYGTTNNLLGKTTVRHEDTNNLLGEGVVRQAISADLLSGFSVRRSTSSELAGCFDSGQNEIELKAGFLIRQELTELLAGFWTPGHIVDLLGEFDVRRTVNSCYITGEGTYWCPDVLCGFYVKPSFLTLKAGFTTKQPNTEEILGEFYIRHPNTAELRCSFFSGKVLTWDLLAGFDIAPEPNPCEEDIREDNIKDWLNYIEEIETGFISTPVVTNDSSIKYTGTNSAKIVTTYSAGGCKEYNIGYRSAIETKSITIAAGPGSFTGTYGEWLEFCNTYGVTEPDITNYWNGGTTLEGGEELDLSGSDGIGFQWYGTDSDSQVDFYVECEGGYYIGGFADGPDNWRWVLLRWRFLSKVGNPDLTRVKEIVWTIHTAGTWRIDHIVSYRCPDMKGIFNVRPGPQRDLSAGFGVAHWTRLKSKFDVGQQSEDLNAKVWVRPIPSIDLDAEFTADSFRIHVTNDLAIPIENAAVYYFEGGGGVEEPIYADGLKLTDADGYVTIAPAGEYRIGVVVTNFTALNADQLPPLAWRTTYSAWEARVFAIGETREFVLVVGDPSPGPVEDELFVTEFFSLDPPPLGIPMGNLDEYMLRGTTRKYLENVTPGEDWNAGFGDLPDTFIYYENITPTDSMTYRFENNQEIFHENITPGESIQDPPTGGTYYVLESVIPSESTIPEGLTNQQVEVLTAQMAQSGIIYQIMDSYGGYYIYRISNSSGIHWAVFEDQTFSVMRAMYTVDGYSEAEAEQACYDWVDDYG